MESRVDGVALIPSGKAALLLEELEEGLGIVAVDLHLLEARELRAVGQLAEVVDALVRTRGLLAKLVAGEIEDFKALGVIFLSRRFSATSLSTLFLLYIRNAYAVRLLRPTRPLS